MNYTILIYETPAELAARTDDRRKDAYWGAYRAYTKALADAGVMIGGAALQPPQAATMVRQRDGKRHVQDGPYAEAKEQDVTRWSASLIDEAERSLTHASQANRPGRFQLEAAIQSVHAHRARTGRIDWEAIALLYEGLLQYAATVGARVARAAAVAEARGVDEGLAALTAMPMETVTAYQPYWALRAHLLARAGRVPEAREAYARASALSEDVAVRAFLDAQVPGGKLPPRPLR